MRSAHAILLCDHQADQLFIDQTLEQLVYEYSHNQPGKQQLFECLLFSVLIKMGRHLHANRRQRSVSQYETRYQQLCELIEKHYREHQSCQFYAEALCTTTIGLNRACKAVASKSAGDLIQDRLALEAQRMLIYSSAPVSLIAYELGFLTQPTFRAFSNAVSAPLHPCSVSTANKAEANPPTHCDANSVFEMYLQASTFSIHRECSVLNHSDWVNTPFNMINIIRERHEYTSDSGSYNWCGPIRPAARDNFWRARESAISS